MVSINKIKLFLLDIDGVLTDGTKVYDLNGKVAYKKFNDKDFTAIKKLKKLGFNVAFISGDDRVNKAIADSRKIKFYYSYNRDKFDFLPSIEKEFEVRRENILYVGDDLPDLEVIKAVGLSFCPNDANPKIKESVSFVLTTPGGHGIIMEIMGILGILANEKV